MEKEIRVNGVAPGPLWTPLIASSFPPEEVAKFGTDSPMKRPAQPYELAERTFILQAKNAAMLQDNLSM